MEKTKTKSPEAEARAEDDVHEQPDAMTHEGTAPADTAPCPEKEISAITDKWKRALADAENARKRADTARMEGREQGIAIAVEALAPALDALALGIEAARKDPDTDDPRIAAHLDGLRNIRTSFETGLKALGVRTIAPEDVPFDPKLHEAMGTQATADTRPGQVLVLHQPGFAIGQRLIRPARVTISAAPSGADKNQREES